MKGWYVPLLILSALAFREAWLLIPESSRTFDPFPFADIQITQQTYFYFAFYYGSNLIFILAFLQSDPPFKEFFHIWFGLQFIELIDYFLTYNQTWYLVGQIHIGITLIKLVTLTITILFGWIYSLYRPRL